MHIEKSLREILESKQVVADLFYVRFLQDPEVLRHFLAVDMKRQAVLLTMALQIVVQYYVNSLPLMEAYFKIRGREHKVRGIGSELYLKFRQCLLETFREFHGPDWTDALERQWTDALELACQKMLSDSNG